MKTIGLPTVQWNADSQQWYITEAGNDQGVELDYWASQRPDLEILDLQLSPLNYACHWIDLPGVKQRMVTQALPFALEEVMIDDIDHYKIIQPVSQKTKHKAYLVNQDLVQSLADLLELHHLQLRSLVPETSRLADVNTLVRHNEGWLLKLVDRFEGWLPDAALMPMLEALVQQPEGLTIDGLVINAERRDLAMLAQTNLDTSFASTFINTVISTGTPSTVSVANNYSFVSPSHAANQTDKTVPTWWGGLAAMAAMWLVLAVGGLFIDNQIKSQQITEVRSQSLNLYKQWFPGERVRFLSRQFDEKLSGESISSSGLLPLLSNLSKAYQQPSIAANLTLVSLRYSDRIDEITIEVSASALPVLQELKVFIENAGLKADIASATNEGDSVKGRVRIGAPA